MEYGEPSEEELKSYTDTAREFKFDLGWLSASKFQEVVKKKMISKADYQKLDQYLAHLRFKQDNQPNEKNKPNKPEDISSFADFLKVCERIYSNSAYAPCDKAPKSADALSAEISSLDSNAKVAASSSDPSTQTYQSTQTESTGTPDAAEEGMDVDTFAENSQRSR